LLLRLRLIGLGSSRWPVLLFVGLVIGAALLLAARALHSFLSALRAFLTPFLRRSLPVLLRGAFRRFLCPFRFVSPLGGRLSVGEAGCEYQSDGCSRQHQVLAHVPLLENFRDDRSERSLRGNVPELERRGCVRPADQIASFSV